MFVLFDFLARNRNNSPRKFNLILMTNQILQRTHAQQQQTSSAFTKEVSKGMQRVNECASKSRVAITQSSRTFTASSAAGVALDANWFSLCRPPLERLWQFLGGVCGRQVRCAERDTPLHF
jgi:hypothetical protein